MTYSEKLKDPRWQKMRLEILSRDKFSCQRCLSPDNTLHIHHLIYIKGRDPWEYHPDHLITLCEYCHEYETDNINAAINRLIKVFKSTWLTDDINKITDGFGCYIHPYHREVGADALSHLLTDWDRTQAMIENYLLSSEVNTKE